MKRFVTLPKTTAGNGAQAAAQKLLQQYLDEKNTVIALVLGAGATANTAFTVAKEIAGRPEFDPTRVIRVVDTGVLTEEQRKQWSADQTVTRILCFDRARSVALAAVNAVDHGEVTLAFLDACGGGT